jgi:hypothetical protein
MLDTVIRGVLLPVEFVLAEPYSTYQSPAPDSTLSSNLSRPVAPPRGWLSQSRIVVADLLVEVPAFRFGVPQLVKHRRWHFEILIHGTGSELDFQDPLRRVITN